MPSVGVLTDRAQRRIEFRAEKVQARQREERDTSRYEGQSRSPCRESGHNSYYPMVSKTFVNY